MGIIAENAMEAVERQQDTASGALTDLRTAISIEFITDVNGKAWVNVDGICLLRVGHVDSILVDTSNTPAELDTLVKS